MKDLKYRRKFEDLWLSLTISKKIRIFVELFFLVIAVSIVFNIFVVKYSLGDFRTILSQEAVSNSITDNLEYETRCFSDYIKFPDDDNRNALSSAINETEHTIASLPFDYLKMGEDRYIRTWSIKNSYEYYSKRRDAVIAMEESNPDYISDVYEIYDMQSFLLDSSKTLMRYAVEEGTAEYRKKLVRIEKIPFAIAFVGLIIFFIIIEISNSLKKNITKPILQLAVASKKIGANDFDFDDIKVINKDEVGELVKAFNKMKCSTEKYISSLNEKRKMAELLHSEEVKRLKAENQLEIINLKLIKSQLDPHFLFNTLNVISGMAVIEEAETTEKMINVMSSLFRYNLKNQDLEVTLSQELKAVNDYMYLTKMRFGERIKYTIENKTDAERIIVPTYLMQPLIENAVKHGISQKEQGGRIIVRIWENEDKLIITMADNGIGMSEERLNKVRSEIKGRTSDTIGIGLSSISKRVTGFYKDGKFEIYSRLNVGTAIRVIIPLHRGE